MSVGCVILACTLLVGASSGSKAGQPLKPPCRPGFTQNFYTVIVSRDVLHGQSILKESLSSVQPGPAVCGELIEYSQPPLVPELNVCTTSGHVVITLEWISISSGSLGGFTSPQTSSKTLEEEADDRMRWSNSSMSEMYILVAYLCVRTSVFTHLAAPLHTSYSSAAPPRLFKLESGG
ncbi:hypothetical protein PAMA_011016 [Pampus argenteus]